MCIHTYLHKHICGYLVSCDTQGMSYCRSIVRKAEKHWSKEDFHSFTSGWPVFPAPVVKEVVFFPLYILASFVKDKVSIGTWIYLWAFCLCASTILSWWLWLCRAWSRLIPPVPFFFLKIALAIQGFLYFHTNCEIICSSSVKNTIGTITRQSEWLLSKSLQAINAGESVEKREPSYTVGGNANQDSHYGKQCGIP